MSLKDSSKNTMLQEQSKRSQNVKADTSYDSNRLTQSEINSLRQDSREADKFFIRYFKENPLV